MGLVRIIALSCIFNRLEMTTLACLSPFTTALFAIETRDGGSPATDYCAVSVYMLVSPYGYNIINWCAVVDFIIDIAPHGLEVHGQRGSLDKEAIHYTIGIRMVSNPQTRTCSPKKCSNSTCYPNEMYQLGPICSETD